MASISDHPHVAGRQHYSVFAADCPADLARAILLRLLVMAASATVSVAVMAMIVAHFARA